MKVLTCQQTRELEKRAVLSGCTYPKLMETAGAAVTGYIRDHYDIFDKHIVILCGKGNNGGDGFVVASRLCDLCGSMTILLLDGLPATELAQEKLRDIRGTSAKVYNLEDGDDVIYSAIRHADLLVDAVYGIGFHGEVPEKLRPVFHAVNQASAPVIAVDIPSGLNGDSNELPECFLRADATITFTTWKPVHIFRPAKDMCGTIRIAQVGIGKNCIAEQAYDIFVTDHDAVQEILKKRNPESHKGTFGRLLAVCGSDGMAGAAVLSASAAIRSGVGLVDMAVPRSIYPIVAANVIEPVYTLLDPGDLGLIRQKLFGKLEKATACLIGCGLGENPDTDRLVCDLIQRSQVPLIIDADGINAVARNIDVLKTAKAPIILTPHPGEMARLIGSTAKAVEANRIDTARKFAAEYNVTLVLKGHNTLIVQPEPAPEGEIFSEMWGKTACNMTGNSGMAKGGSGDVLAGLIGGLCAQGIPGFAAAYTGVYLHGEAGDRCAARYSEHGMLPTHMVEQLSTLFSEYE